LAILAGIHSLLQHVQHQTVQPNDYRPDRCPSCGKSGLWAHGAYTRKSNRRGLNQSTDAPIRIPRFLCRDCRSTCSCLPEAIPPRRWYLWDVQQTVLYLLLGSTSLNRTATQVQPSRQTIKRWWRDLQARFIVDSAALRSRFAELGRFTGFQSFWQHCLDQMRLSRAMLYLHQCGTGLIMPIDHPTQFDHCPGY